MTITLMVIGLIAVGLCSGAAIGATILRDWIDARRPIMPRARLPRAKVNTVNSTTLYLAWSNPQKTRRKW